METDNEERSYLPSNWGNDVRMNALFSEFRDRNVNPNDWTAKINFWTQLIMDYAVKCDKVTFKMSELRDAFNRNGKTPRCLNTVLAEMTKQGQLMTLDDFFNYTSEPGWVGWSWDIFVKRPLSWSWSLVSNMLYQTPSQDTDVRYVDIQMLREKAEAVLRIHQNLVESGEEDWTISFEDLYKHCRDVCKSENQLHMYLRVLRKDKKCTLYQEQHLIRFVKNGQSQPTQLSQKDKALVQLRKTKQTLEQQISLYETEIKRCLNEARYYKKLGQNTLAKSSLQKKKQTEKLLEQKECALDNVESLLFQLKESGTQKDIYDALQASSSALKANNMDLDKVYDTVAVARETIEDQEEIEAAMASPIGPRMDVSELEKELEDLLGEDDIATPKHISTPKQKQDDNDLMRRLSKLRELDFPDLPQVAQTSKSKTLVH